MSTQTRSSPGAEGAAYTFSQLVQGLSKRARSGTATPLLLSARAAVLCHGPIADQYIRCVPVADDRHPVRLAVRQIFAMSPRMQPMSLLSSSIGVSLEAHRKAQYTVENSSWYRRNSRRGAALFP